jgi:hypothetical protein
MTADIVAHRPPPAPTVIRNAPEEGGVARASPPSPIMDADASADHRAGTGSDAVIASWSLGALRPAVMQMDGGEVVVAVPGQVKTSGVRVSDHEG